MTPEERRARMNDLFFEMEALATELDRMEDEYAALEVFEQEQRLAAEEQSKEEPGQE